MPDRARAAIKELLAISPTMARVRTDRGEQMRSPDAVRPGEDVVVKPGEQIPVDGRVVEGVAFVDQASITGEAMPEEKALGSAVYAGTIVQDGAVVVRAHRVGKDTTLSKIIRLVEEAETSKAPVQRIADRFAAYFTPVVLTIAFGTLLGTRVVSGAWDIIPAVSVIVVACPCAIALATPLAVIAASGKAARQGIVIKGGRYIEALSKVDVVVVDKTGTLTMGTPSVTEVIACAGETELDVLLKAAIAERLSEHALARAILGEAEARGIDVPYPEDFRVIPGRGVVATHDGRRIILGRRELVEAEGFTVCVEADDRAEVLAGDARSVMYVAADDRVIGLIGVSDVVKDETRGAIDELRALGVNEIVMVTGDHAPAAAAVAESLALDGYHADLLPEDMLRFVRALESKGRWATASTTRRRSARRPSASPWGRSGRTSRSSRRTSC